MGNPLRAIALTVDEPSPGLFYWTLLESGSGRRTFDQHVAAADDAYDSFEKAARAGLLRWLRLAGDDVRHGPRQPRANPACTSRWCPSLARGRGPRKPPPQIRPETSASFWASSAITYQSVRETLALSCS